MSSPSAASRTDNVATVSSPASENVRKCPSFSTANAPDAPPDPSTDLEPRQLTAIDLLLTGANDLAVARHLSISPRTLYRWKYHSESFRAELSRRREDLYGQSTDRLREMLNSALDTLEYQVKHPHDLTSHRAAATLLRISRLARNLLPTMDDR